MDNKSPLESLVEKYGGIDKLSAEERSTYLEHLKIAEGKPLSIDSVKDFARSMITQIERLLVDSPEGSIDSLALKARLKNMLVLEAYLFSPERAKKAIDTYYSNLKDNTLK